MPSSNRTSHLALWREIVCKHQEGTQPVNQDIDSIRKRFDQLDSEGFIWSKESIMEIFLQLGQSENTHGSFSSTHQIDESCVVHVNNYLSDEDQIVTQSEEILHKPHPLGLMDIPIEVFGKILEILNMMAKFEAGEVTDQKSKRKVMITGPGDREPYLTYLYQDPPILNTIQSFSLTSRAIYQRCQPLLWHKLKFPTRLPAPIDLWTKDILFRQGRHVRSLSLTLSENCSVPPDEFVELDPFYDNLTPDVERGYRVQWVSQKNVKDLINSCPNLSTLNLDYEFEQLENTGGLEIFLLELLPVLSSLKQLRQLSLVDGCDKSIMNQFPSKVIGSLPLLESLTLGGLTASRDQRTIGDDSFGFKCSKLESLSRLELWRIEDIGEDWCLYSWPRTITNLELHECGDLSISLASQIIHHIAPYLTELKLGFRYDRGEENRETDSRWDPQTRFSLPNLTDLELFTGNPNLLDSFEDCKTLKCLDWSYMTLEHCMTLSRNLFKVTWPQLKKLDVAPWVFLEASDFGPRYPELEDQLVSFEKYCKEANIQSIIRRPYSP